MIVITQTRYGGVYEGGPWAAFCVPGPTAVPDTAYGEDPDAVEWWWEPTVPVAAGDSPDEATERLRFLLDRDAGQRQESLFADDARVIVTGCAPSEWWPGEAGIVESSEFVAAVPFCGGLRGQFVCTVVIADPATSAIRIPERFLRPG